ncbi:chromosome segregation protein SMC [Terrarubrum flagellatum]|uniref:chromosome segregation protein SMC n=1 Tax=Terrirubrum flagellatum TaxID=2895980 RepID=UPI0031454C2C
MKLTKLRIAGFKSFVEPTEFLIEPGLTGVVGPNGCGKSNLVEAMRWVMGENSYKSMRASGMDDVIFSGSGTRPARNAAEVALTIDNSDRRAPAAFNEHDGFDVSRRIEREEGSVYRVNGKEVRARDVQLLFADASTGSRSPAMVRQGQIGEIIAAKPQQRRRILEDAAGIAGLHARRHEAELRLKAAEDNLVRLEDVLREIEGQIDSLGKQAKQASRYKVVAADIRRNEALIFYLTHREAKTQLAEAERSLEAETRLVADRTAAQAAAATAQAIAASSLPGLRESEAAAAAALQRLLVARDTIDAEERRARERAAELEMRAAELVRDIERETALAADAVATLKRLDAEVATLDDDEDGSGEAREMAAARQLETEAALAEAEAELDGIQRRVSDISVRRDAALRAAAEEETRVRRLHEEQERILRELEAIAQSLGPDADPAPFAEAFAAAEEAAEEADGRLEAARATLASAREAESRLRQPASDADRKAQRLETEVATLKKLLAGAGGDLWPPVVESISVAKGYETALGAALGDDLDASLEESAPAHWAAPGASEGDPALPEGARPLTDFAQAPAVLQRRLRQIGVVRRVDGARLRALLKPGQRLVSVEGDLWRWDGLTTAAEAPTPAARRLAEKNRLSDLEAEAETARTAAEAARAELETTIQAVRAGAQSEGEANNISRQARAALDAARSRAAAAERRRADVAAKTSALGEGKARVEASLAEAEGRLVEAKAATETLLVTPEMEQELSLRRAGVSEARAALGEARANAVALTREAEARARRRAAITADREGWASRRERAAVQIDEFEARIAAARAEKEQLDEVPGQLVIKRRAVVHEIEGAEAKRKEAADALVQAETSQVDADRAAREALAAMSEAREAKARAEARLDAATTKLADTEHAITETLETTPDALPAMAGIEPGADLPAISDVERKLSSMKAERERLGAVNLRADVELEESTAKKDSLISERDDLTEAIKKLRTAIQSLNKEGRERLLGSFDTVNNHFKELFTLLFGGGAAELQLIESDDPLEAGLEIIARPPGKKPQVMTLLSGGEQALTATALIFAVFLTNPSPICVLDEVDAPLDDANVERYCDLLADMASKTDTRFIVITHNPITMARMDRLFGVTMAERGVSQLVSVDLQTAERVIQAAE